MNSRMKWNNKYLDRISQSEEPTPNPRLQAVSAYLNGGYALDLACGLGANSLFLARMNYQVQALDISDVAINYLLEKVAKFNLDIHPQVCDLTDLSNLKCDNSRYDLVVITYYLDRSLYPILKKIIKEKGCFFMETFFQTPNNNNQCDVSNQYKLKPKELFSEFGDWNVLFFEEHEQEGRQTIFCQKRL